MNTQKTVKEQLRRFNLPSDRREELIIEYTDHVTTLKEAYAAEGMEEQEAWNKARKTFGGVKAMTAWHERPAIQFFFCFLIYLLSYMLTYVVTHTYVSMPFHTEGNLMAVMPALVTGLFFMVITKNGGSFKKLFLVCMVPLFVLEKILAPFARYISLHIHGSVYEFSSFEQAAGFPKEDYMYYLMHGEVGGLDFYSSYYLISSAIILFLLYTFFKSLHHITWDQHLRIGLSVNILVILLIMGAAAYDDRFIGFDRQYADVLMWLGILLLLFDFGLCGHYYVKQRQEPGSSSS
ncbi:permease prefix domain 1-containing protein [Salibacterium sp. K-3]